jgi:hypothetical protein
MPVILATWEAEIRRIKVQTQPTKVVQDTLSGNKVGGVAQGIQQA